MHDLLLIATDPASSTQLKSALIGALALLIAAVIPVLISTREKEPRSARRARLAEDRLLRNLQDERDEMEADLKAARARIAELEGFCWRHRIDPATGQVIAP